MKILQKKFPNEYERLNAIFGEPEGSKSDRIDEIYKDCEEQWEKNLERLNGIEVKYLLIAEAPPWSESGVVRYFYGTFVEGNNGKPISWIRDLWTVFYPRDDTEKYDTEKCLNKLAQKQFLLIDSLPFAMKYNSNIRKKNEYKEIIKSCSYFLSKVCDKRIKWTNDVKVAFAFQLNGEALIEAFPDGIKLPSGQHIEFKKEMIAATGCGFPTCTSLKKRWGMKC